MFSAKENVQMTLALLRAYGIRQAVLCPGSRDIPLIQGLAQCPEITCHAFTDERSAGFAAIGIITQLHEPCAVVVTSGSALLNLHPAVGEAFYRHLPLLILSADRAPAWIDQNDGQTLPQPRVFKRLVKYSGIAYEIKDTEDRWHCRRVVNEALLALTCPPYAPVHLNIPISDPFFDFNVSKLPSAARMEYISLSKLDRLLADYHRILLILAQNDYAQPPSREEQSALAQRFSVAAEQLSNAQSTYFITLPEVFAAKLLQSNDAKQEHFAPDLVITLGGQILSKSLKRYLRRCRCDHLDINAEGAVNDVFMHLRYIVQADYHMALQTLCTLPRKNLSKPYLTPADVKPKADPNTLPLPYSQLSLLQLLIAKLPKDSVLHLANSSTVRYAAYFALPPRVRVVANRGVNGIEGSLSSAVGAALADPTRLHFICIGDLSFFYDLNALWTRSTLRNLRVVLFNNCGGEIFAALPGLSLDDRSARFVTAPHYTSAVSWAISCGFNAVQIQDEAAFTQALPAFLQESDTPQLLEILTAQESDLAALQLLKAALQ